MRARIKPNIGRMVSGSYVKKQGMRFGIH